MTDFNKVKAGYKTFRKVKYGLIATTSPVRWAKRKIILAVKSGLVVALTKKAGGPAARAMIEKLDLAGKTYPLVFTVPLHAKIRRFVSNPEHVEFVQEVINDVLAIPLAVWGYRLAQFSFTCPEARSDLLIRVELGLKRLDTAAVPTPKVVPVAPVEPAPVVNKKPRLFQPPDKK